MKEAEEKAIEAERKAQKAEQKAREAEQKAKEAEQKEIEAEQKEIEAVETKGAIASRLLAKGMNNEEVAETTDLDVDRVHKIKHDLLK